VRSESGEVAFPFQSFLDSGKSAARRMPDTVHPLSRKRVEFECHENVGSEFVNRPSCPPSVPMSGNVDRVHEIDGGWMKAMTDKLDVLWSAVNRNMAMSVPGEGENSDTCRSAVRSRQVSSAVNNANNVPSVRTSEAVDAVQRRRRVWCLDSETEVDLDTPARPKPVMSRGDQGRNCGSVIVLSKGTTHQLNSKIDVDLV